MGAPIPNDARLKGPFKPMRFEATVPDCIVTEGEIPKDLCGGFYRNGPTWRRPTKQGTNGTSPRTGWSRGSSSKTGALTFATAESAPRSFFPKQRHGSGLLEWADGKFTDWRAQPLHTDLPAARPRGPFQQKHAGDEHRPIVL